MIITESLDDQLMATAAHRYCLGRRSYIVSSCLDWLRACWPQFTRQTKLVILRDTIEAIMDGEAGSPAIDEPGWRDFAGWAWEQLAEDREGRVWLRQAVAWKESQGKVWPIGEGSEVATASDDR